MTMSSLSKDKPVVVVVTGSFSPTSGYDVFVDHLNFLGYHCIVIDLPTIGRRDHLNLPPATMSDDAAHIRSVVQGVFDETGNNVVLVAHSYGGIPATESLKGVTRKERSREGKLGGVEKVIYTTALTPPIGKSLQDAFGDVKLDFIGVKDGYMYHNGLQDSAVINFSSLPVEEGIEQVRRFSEHSAVSFTNPLTHAGYKDVDVTYVLFEKDKTIPADVQEQFIKWIQEAKDQASGDKVEVVKINSDHCWNASTPRFVARRIVEILGGSVDR